MAPQQRSSQESSRKSSQSEKSSSDQNGGDGAVGFWDRELSNVRKKTFAKVGLMTLFLGTIVFCLLSLFWGSLQKADKNLPSLTVLVVDFDSKVAPYTGTTAVLGPLVTQAAQKQNSSPRPHLGFIVHEPSVYDNDPMNVRRAIFAQEHWVGIVVNSNATALLEDAISRGNASYDPMGAAQMIFVEARDDQTIAEFIMPFITKFQTHVVAEFGKQWAQNISGRLDNATVRSNIAAAPQALNPAIGFTTYNLRPFEPPVALPAVSIGLIYLIILSFFSFSFFAPIHQALITPEGHKPLKYNQWIIWRITITIGTYFILSLFYSLVSLAFHIPFSRSVGPHTEVANASHYGKGTFVVYWMLNWVAIAALGFASENMAMILGFPWFALWLIFWVISNVCTAFYPIATAPGFYRYGAAWPLHNVVEASRTIIFDTHSRLGLNFGVLFAWIAIDLALFPFCAHFARWKLQRQQKKLGVQKTLEAAREMVKEINDV